LSIATSDTWILEQNYEKGVALPEFPYRPCFHPTDCVRCFSALELPGFGVFEVMYVGSSEDKREEGIQGIRGIRQSYEEGVRSYKVVSCFEGPKERTLPRAWSPIMCLMLKLKMEVCS